MADAGETKAKRRADKKLATGKDKPAPEFFRGAKLMHGEEHDHEVEFTEISDPKRRLYLEAIAKNGPRYGLAARAAGISAATGYLWRHKEQDPVFQDALLRAHKMGIEALEAEFIRRGFKGYEKPVYQGGRLVGTVQEYDTTAGIFMLKALAPERHRERFEHSGPSGGPMQHQVHALVANMSDDDLRARLAEVTRALQEGPQALPAAPGQAIDVTPVGEGLSEGEAAYARKLAERAKGNGHGGHG